MISPAQRVELDDVDRALIAALIADGRATYAALAPLVGLSQAAVRTRVQRLIDEHIITVTGRVDPASLGLGIFAFAFLEVRGEVEKVAARIADIDEAVFVAIGAGRHDLLVELRCRGEDRLLDALDRIRVIDDVRRVQSATVLHYEKQDWTSLGNRVERWSQPSLPVRSRVLDDIDRLLVVELMADGRATYTSLAGVVGLSQAAVRDRVIDLLDDRIVTIQAHPDPVAMGIGGFAGLLVKVTGPVAPLAAALVERPETDLVVRTLGRYDILAEVWFDNNDHLAELLDDLRALPGMGSIDTIPYLRIAHEAFGSGLRRREERA